MPSGLRRRRTARMALRSRAGCYLVRAGKTDAKLVNLARGRAARHQEGNEGCCSAPPLRLFTASLGTARDSTPRGVQASVPHASQHETPPRSCRVSGGSAYSAVRSSLLPSLPMIPGLQASGLQGICRRLRPREEANSLAYPLWLARWCNVPNRAQESWPGSPPWELRDGWCRG